MIAAMDDQNLLAGIRVVDFTRYLPGPACTLQLAWLGAHVDAVEQPPAGDPMRAVPPLGDDGISLASRSLGRGKYRHLLDLRSADGKAAAIALIAEADVVVEGFRPGVAERLGIGPATLRERFPRLIACSITGYGQTGPWAQRAGHDGNYLAITGLLERCGPPQAPVLPPVPLADLAGASMAATAICAALVCRARIGEGALIDLSLAEAALAWQAHSLPGAETFDGPRGAGLLNGGLATYAIYACADGQHLLVAPIEPKFFARLLQLLDLPPELAHAQYDLARQAELRAALTQRLAARTASEWAELLEGEETCVTRVMPAHEVAAHEQHVAREALESMGDGIFAPRAPWVVDCERVDHGAVTPQVGQT